MPSNIHCRNGPDGELLPLSLQTSSQARGDIHHTWSSFDPGADNSAQLSDIREGAPSVGSAEALNSYRGVSNKYL